MARHDMNSTQKNGVFIAATIFFVLLALHNPFGGYKRTKVLYNSREFINKFREAVPESATLDEHEIFSELSAKSPEYSSWISEFTYIADPYNVEMPKALRSLKKPNLGIPPPPAYYGVQPQIISRKSVAQWIDEPLEFAGYVLPLIFLVIIYLYLFRNPKPMVTSVSERSNPDIATPK